MFLGTRLNKVLNEGFQSKDDILKSFDTFDVMDELIHGRLAMSKLHLSVLCPEVVASHHGTCITHLFLLSTEQLTGQRFKGEVAETRITDNGKRLHERSPAQLGEKVVGGECPGSIGKTGELLCDGQATDKIDIALWGNGKLTTAHLP